MFSSPNCGPTLTSSTMRAGAGSEPAFKRPARSLASSIFCSMLWSEPKLICERPLVIAVCTLGALNTNPSSTTATARWLSAAHSVVIRPQMPAPSASMVMETTTSPISSYETRASTMLFPDSLALPLRLSSRIAYSAAKFWLGLASHNKRKSLRKARRASGRRNKSLTRLVSAMAA